VPLYPSLWLTPCCSIAKTWENVNTDHADVKELIPEFYQNPGGAFLNNSMVSKVSHPLLVGGADKMYKTLHCLLFSLELRSWGANKWGQSS